MGLQECPKISEAMITLKERQLEYVTFSGTKNRGKVMLFEMSETKGYSVLKILFITRYFN